MKYVFWISLALIAYAYAGYPLWVYLRAKIRPRPVRKANNLPSISIVVAARNEAGLLPQKIQNLRALDYPENLREIVIVSDGSTDGTSGMIQELKVPGLRFAELPEHAGKAAALDFGVRLAKGEIVIFTDARQMLEPGSARVLMESFADPEVGCVSGALELNCSGSESSAKGIGTYWSLEKAIRQWEALGGSVVGATGAFYAVRKELIPELPAGTILDDVYIPLCVGRAGKRVVFEPGAMAHDELAKDLRQEYRRKVRTLMGNYQLLQLAPWLLTGKNPIRFEFISHKLLRLLVPFATLAIVISSVYLSGRFYVIPVAAAGCVGLLALLGFLKAIPRFIRPLGDLALAFLMLNSAAAVAFVYFVSGKKAIWAR